MATPPQGNTATAVIDNGSQVVGGTANGVLYVNSSGNLDSGSVLAFDGTTTLSLVTDSAVISLGASSNVKLNWDAAGILAQRNGTNAQVFRVYNTYTSASVYESFDIDWQTTANTCAIRTQHTGATARSLVFRYGNSALAAISIGITGASTTPIDLSGASSTTANTIRVRIGSGVNISATSGTCSELILNGGATPTGTSTMVWQGLALTNTINYSNGTPGAGQIKMIYLNPTNTALPTGLNAACVFSSTASALGGMIFHNQTDEATNYELGRLRFLSNDFLIEAAIGGSGTARFIGLGLGGFGATVKYKYATASVTAAAGATVTATSLIPAKANLVAVITRVTTQLGAGSGTTGYTVGDGSDADRWGSVTGVIVGTDTDQSDATADPTGWFTAANNVVLTALGGNFDGTGVIRVTAIYIDSVAATS